MDFRMERSSWLMVAFMFITFIFFILRGSGTDLPFVGYLQVIGYALLILVALVALACIPVLIVCYFIKKIPDIDYSIWVATGVTLIGIISELF
jgi:hypothetical protein